MNICCRKQLLQFGQHDGQRRSLIQFPFVMIQEHRGCQIPKHYHRWLSLRLLIGIQQENHPSALQLARPATDGQTSICPLFYRLILYPQKIVIEWWDIRPIMRDIEDNSQLTISAFFTFLVLRVLSKASPSLQISYCTVPCNCFLRISPTSYIYYYNTNTDHRKRKYHTIYSTMISNIQDPEARKRRLTVGYGAFRLLRLSMCAEREYASAYKIWS